MGTVFQASTQKGGYIKQEKYGDVFIDQQVAERKYEDDTQELLNKNPNDPNIFLKLIHLKLSREKIEDAIQLFKIACDRNCVNSQILNRLKSILQERNRFEDLKTGYKIAIKHDQSNPMLYADFSEIVCINDYEESKKILIDGISKCSSNFLLNKRLQQVEDLIKAEKDKEKELDFYTKQDYLKDIDTIKNYIDSIKSENELLNLSDLVLSSDHQNEIKSQAIQYLFPKLIEIKKIDSAIRILTEAISLIPNDVFLLRARGDLYGKNLNEIEKARQDYLTILEIDYKNMHVRTALVGLLRKKAEFDKSLAMEVVKYIEELQSVCESPLHTYIRTYSIAPVLLAKHGERAKAKEMADITEKCLNEKAFPLVDKLSSNDRYYFSVAFSELSEYYFKIGDTTKNIEMLQKGIKTDPKQKILRDRLKKALFLLND